MKTRKQDKFDVNAPGGDYIEQFKFPDPTENTETSDTDKSDTDKDTDKSDKDKKDGDKSVAKSVEKPDQCANFKRPDLTNYPDGYSPKDLAMEPCLLEQNFEDLPAGQDFFILQVNVLTIFLRKR